MRVLAIETSCDETGIAIVEGEKKEKTIQFNVQSASLFSQASLHAVFGGVYPTLAKREHEKNLPLLLEETLTKAKYADSDFIDAIAVTRGPGLEPALWSGIVFAQALAERWHKPLFGVNHMEGHLVSSLVQHETLEDTNLPLVALLISGGHTEFIHMKEWFSYEVIGKTLDDAVGEAFDKIARMLGLPYPGGPHISRLAENARKNNLPKQYSLPRPMLSHDTCDMSFSGLKTAALYALRDRGGMETLSEDEKSSFAREFEDAVTETLIVKTKRALSETKASSFVIGGGVAANTHIRASLEAFVREHFTHMDIYVPEVSITGDNAIMIAQAALMHLILRDWTLENPHKDITAQGGLSIESNK